MIEKIKHITNLIGNMGWRYVGFRARYEVLKRAGLLKNAFPVNPPFKRYFTLAKWKEERGFFFFNDRESLKMVRQPSEALQNNFERFNRGSLILFNSTEALLGKDYDWVTNPDSNYKYDANKHWTEIADLSKEAGDIKYVWEKSRFSYLYDIIRYDYHFEQDCSAMVFNDILSWIDGNPVNCGPNYRCSQEISLRVLNWTFALYYYSNAAALTEEIFDKIQHAIYWQMKHVYSNIDFSRIAVRNNHAITETLALYIVGMLYPSFPEAAMWKRKGKAWFEEEIAYQIYDDGTFLQFSMNYHRVVVQLLTWAINIADNNKEQFDSVVYERAKKSVYFLRTCMIDEHGWLPNYGANDGALFFKLDSAHYRDYRPQLDALAQTLGIDLSFLQSYEDVSWYGIASKQNKEKWSPGNGAHGFTKGGYYIIREPDTLTFIKCGSYKDRPSHADNLHMDVWYKGENILLDAGSYKYNTDDATIRYFGGTASHNTVMVNDSDQMLKGGRFIWYYWSQATAGSFVEEGGNYVFSGTVTAFKQLGDNIQHKRTIVKKKNLPVWEIQDQVMNVPDNAIMKQLWHLPATTSQELMFASKDNDGEELEPVAMEGWGSPLYGIKEKARALYFSTGTKIISTTITIKQ